MSGRIQFSVDPRVFEHHPGAAIAVVSVENADNSSAHEKVQELFAATQGLIKQSLTKEMFATHPYFSVWRDAYRKFGAKPKDHLCSVENITTRVLKTGIKSVNPLVDLYNSISLKYQLPAGGEDLATIKGSIQLTIAGDNEQAVCLLGDKEPRAPQLGEIFYKDNYGAICRRWNWKEADRTKLTPQTRQALLVLEALPPVSIEYLQAAAEELAHAVARYTGAHTGYALVTAQSPALEIAEIPLTITPENARDMVVAPAWKDNVLVAPEKDAVQASSSAEHKVRAQKVEELRKLGIEPWPSQQAITATCQQVVKEFGQDEQRQYVIAGRLMSCREHGKTIFGHVQDATARLQIYVKQDALGADNFALFKNYLDLGDVISCAGTSFKTKTGEITLQVSSFALLAKCLHPLPEKFHGVTDVETRYRQRYLDLMTNDQTRDRFIKRSKIVRFLRNFLDAHGYLEVETPMLHPIPGGAAARPFVTHHNALTSDFYLRIAPELYLKRLVVGGIERVYEINRNFRNEGISTRHNPEFTMLEFYTAHQDYRFSMDFVETMFRSVAQEICGTLTVPFGAHHIDFSQPFKRLNAAQAIVAHSDITQADLTPAALDHTLAKHGVTVAANTSYMGKLFKLFEEVAESKLIQPTFIIDFPVEISPLAKRDPQNPVYAARYELYIAGMEISNSYNELNDPFEQAERFKEQVKAHASGDDEAHHYDADFITALEYGLAPTVGVGIGIDRLVMILTNTTSIKDIILFPTLKRKES